MMILKKGGYYVMILLEKSHLMKLLLQMEIEKKQYILEQKVMNTIQMDIKMKNVNIDT